MDKFEVIQPSALLAPYVKHYWFLEIDSVNHPSQRIHPVGYIDLVFHRGNRLHSSTDRRLQPQAFICGQTFEYNDVEASGRLDMINVVFQPVGARTFFSTPMIELKGYDVSIDEMSDPQLAELGKRIMDTPDNRACVLLIEEFLMKRLGLSRSYNHKRIAATVQAINSGQSDVSMLADISCLSYKQFKRVFSEYVGANPKEFLRVVRFQRALYTLQTNPQISLTQLAVDCEYYDQSHLIKEFRQFSGYTPTEYIAICAPHSDYFS